LQQRRNDTGLSTTHHVNPLPVAIVPNQSQGCMKWIVQAAGLCRGHSSIPEVAYEGTL
jgi:hypothetical protein